MNSFGVALFEELVQADFTNDGVFERFDLTEYTVYDPGGFVFIALQQHTAAVMAIIATPQTYILVAIKSYHAAYTCTVARILPQCLVRYDYFDAL